MRGEVAADRAADRLDAVADGLHAKLAARPPDEHERDAGPVFAALKESRATAMLVPERCGGGGASAADAVRFQVALGSLAPSAAVATTMHHYKIAALGQVARSAGTGAGTGTGTADAAEDTGSARAAAVILRDIAAGARLVASGGAESTPGRDLRTLGSTAVRDGEGGAFVVSGLKRPCSLSASMDVMSLMAEVRAPDGSFEGHAQVFVPAGAEGLTREPFWRSPVFLAAESHAVRLTRVRVAGDRVFPLRGRTGARFAADCYLWFQLLIGASYLGVAQCLAGFTAEDRRAGSRRWNDAVEHLRDLEENLLAAARAVDDGAPTRDRLNLAVRARDRIEDELGGIGGELLRAAGGGVFARTGLPAALAGALHAIAFHPPQRGAREGTGLELLDPELRDRA